MYDPLQDAGGAGSEEETVQELIPAGDPRTPPPPAVTSDLPTGEDQVTRQQCLGPGALPPEWTK